MPWGEWSVMDMDASDSDDGPIYWVRPGEQVNYSYGKIIDQISFSADPHRWIERRQEEEIRVFIWTTEESSDYQVGFFFEIFEENIVGFL